MEVLEWQGELIPVDEIENEWGNIAKIINTSVLNIGPKVSPLIVSMDDARKISKIIQNECREILTDVSKNIKTNKK